VFWVEDGRVVRERVDEALSPERPTGELGTKSGGG
jgi:hypothetical protein